MDDIILPEEIYDNLKTASTSISEGGISNKKSNNLVERLTNKKREHVLPTYGKVSKILTAAEKARYNAIGAELFGNGQVVKEIQTNETAKWWEKKGAQFANFMTQLRQGFLNLKKRLDSSFLWDVFKRGAIILLLLLMRAQDWKISWERIKKVPQKIYNLVKRQLVGPESIPKKYETVGRLITNIKDTWQDFILLIQNTNWKEVKSELNINGLTKILDKTARTISTRIYDIVSKLNPLSWFDENTAKEDAKMQARLLSNGDKAQMEQDMQNELITEMDDFLYIQHGVALLQNNTLAEMLGEVGDIETETITRGNGQKEKQIVSLDDTIINFSDATDLQQNLVKARKAITSKAQEGIESIRGMSSKAAMNEIIATLENRSSVITAEERGKLLNLLGINGSETQKALGALKQLQSMAQKTITYADNDDGQTKEEEEETQPSEKPPKKSIIQIIREQRDAMQEALNEAEDMASKINGAVLAAFKEESSVKKLISKRDETFPSEFIDEAKSFINDNFKEPNGTPKIKQETTITNYENNSSLTTVTIINTKTESTALNDIILMVGNNRNFITNHIAKIKKSTDKMVNDREQAAHT